MGAGWSSDVARAARLAPFTLMLALAACDRSVPEAASAPAEPKGSSVRAAPSLACNEGDLATAIKGQVFARARAMRPDSTALIDQLATIAPARLDAAQVRSDDRALAVTVCRAAFVLDLPPGTTDPLTGASRLSTRLDFAVQQAAGGRAVHLLSAVDPLVYPIAAIALARKPVAVAAAAQPVAPAPVPTAQRTAPPAPARARRVQPTFDCRSAQSAAEQMVCRDGYLAQLDRAVAERYAWAEQVIAPERRFRLERTRDRFLDRLDRCDRPACVEDVYQDRLEQIARIASR